MERRAQRAAGRRREVRARCARRAASSSRACTSASERVVACIDDDERTLVRQDPDCLEAKRHMRATFDNRDWQRGNAGFRVLCDFKSGPFQYELDRTAATFQESRARITSIDWPGNGEYHLHLHLHHICEII